MKAGAVTTRTKRGKGESPVPFLDHPVTHTLGKTHFNFAINTPRANKRRVKRLDAVRGHDHLHCLGWRPAGAELQPRSSARTSHLNIASFVETIELVEELKHRALDLLLARAVRVIAFSADGVNLRQQRPGLHKRAWTVMLMQSHRPRQ